MAGPNMIANMLWSVCANSYLIWCSQVPGRQADMQLAEVELLPMAARHEAVSPHIGYGLSHWTCSASQHILTASDTN